MKGALKVMLAMIVFVYLLQIGTVAHGQYGGESDAAALRELVDIPLSWSPTESPLAMDFVDTTYLKPVRIAVKPLHDMRRNKKEIGRNIELRLADRVIYVTTRTDIPAWLAGNLVTVLNDFDANISNDYDIALDADILRFYSVESSEYKSTVALKVRAFSRSGALLWEDVVVGKSVRRGRSYQSEHYCAGLSNATIDAVYNLVKNESFRQVVLRQKK